MLISKTLLQIDFRIRLQIFCKGLKIKNDLQKRQLDEQERHLVIEMSTSEMTHVGGERESTPVKQYQGKA
jgi:hypothetical protein